PNSLRRAGRDRSSGRRPRQGRPPRGRAPCPPGARSRRGSPRRWRGKSEARLVKSLSATAGKPLRRYGTRTLAIGGPIPDRIRPWLGLLLLALLVKAVLIALTLVEFGAAPAPLTVVVPPAYFPLVGYPEALFCALAFGAVLAARRQRWLVAGMLGGLAAAARLTGLALLPFLVIELFYARRSLREAWQVILAPALIV